MKWDYSAVCLEPLENRCLLQGVPIVGVHATQPDVTTGSNAALIFTSNEILATSLTIPFTLSGTAVNGVDINTLPTSVTIQPGAISQTLPVTIIDNPNIFMPDTVLTATITPQASFDINPVDSSATMFINHAGPRLSVQAHNSTTSLPFFTLSLNSTQNTNLIVPLTVTGTAINGEDISLIPDTIVFPAGQRTVTIPVQPLQPNLDGDTVILSLTATDQFHVNRHASTATIVLGETAATSVAVVATQPVADVNGQNGIFTVSRTGDTGTDLSVPFRITGTARSGVNFQPIASPVIIPAGQTSVDVDVIPINTNTVTPNRTVIMTLLPTPEAPIQTGFASATVTIAQVGPTVSVVATDPSASENGNTGTFTFSRTGDTTDALPVTFKLGGSAKNGVNYERVSTTVLIPAGQKSATLTIVPIDVDNPEIDRTVTVTLSNTSTFVADTTARKATVTIASDISTVSIIATQPNASEDGTTGTVQVHRTSDLDEALTVKLKFGGNTKAGVDYQRLPKTVTFGVGQDTLNITIVPINDNKLDKSTTLVISLVSSKNYKIAKAQSKATVFIAEVAPGALAATMLSQWRPVDDQFDLLNDAASATSLSQTAKAAVPLVRLV